MPPLRAGRKRGSPQWLPAVVRRRGRKWCRARLSFGKKQVAKLDACHIHGPMVTCNLRVRDEAEVESNRGSAARPNGGTQDIPPHHTSRQNIAHQGIALRDFSCGGLTSCGGLAPQDCASRHAATKVVTRQGEGVSCA